MSSHKCSIELTQFKVSLNDLKDMEDLKNLDDLKDLDDCGRISINGERALAITPKEAEVVENNNIDYSNLSDFEYVDNNGIVISDESEEIVIYGTSLVANSFTSNREPCFEYLGSLDDVPDFCDLLNDKNINDTTVFKDITNGNDSRYNCKSDSLSDCQDKSPEVIRDYSFSENSLNESILRPLKRKSEKREKNKRLVKKRKLDYNELLSSSKEESEDSSDNYSPGNESEETSENNSQISEEDDELMLSYEKKNMEKRSDPTDNSTGIGIQQYIPLSTEGGKYYYKDNFCIYCKTLQNKIDKHFPRCHFDEEDVRKAYLLKAGSLERRRAIGAIRKRGNSYFNKNRSVNPGGLIIAERRRRISKKDNVAASLQVNETENNDVIFDKNGVESVVKLKHTPVLKKIECEYCHGYFSYRNLHNHVKSFHNVYSIANSRSVKTGAIKQMNLAHEIARKEVKFFILPKLKLDDVGIICRYDKVIILFLNKYAKRYIERDQQSYLRNHARLLGVLVLNLRKVCQKITELEAIFSPDCIRILFEAMELTCRYNSEENVFDKIYSAETLPIIFRKLFKVLRSYYTIENNINSLENLEKFIRVFDNEIDDFSFTAYKSRKQFVRHRNEQELPSTEDIYTFEQFLMMKREVSLRHFSNGGKEYLHWLNIAQTTAGLIMVYNRRRSLEISKILLRDFNSARKVDPSSEFFKMLSKEEQNQKLKYLRIDIQGKRYDGYGSIYLSQKNEESVRMLIKYRDEVGIPRKNPYIFAKITNANEEYKHISICQIITKLSLECSVKYKAIKDKTIRGTLLRKQFATLNTIISADNALAAKQLGHSLNTQSKHYRQKTDMADAAITSLLDKINVPITGSQEPTTSFDHGAASEHTIKRKKVIIKSKKRKVETSDDEYRKSKKALKKRRSWTFEERRAFEEGFASQLERQEHATATQIRAVKIQYPALKGRSEKTIRARFSNIFACYKKY